MEDTNYLELFDDCDDYVAPVEGETTQQRRVRQARLAGSRDRAAGEPFGYSLRSDGCELGYEWDEVQDAYIEGWTE